LVKAQLNKDNQSDVAWLVVDVNSIVESEEAGMALARELETDLQRSTRVWKIPSWEPHAAVVMAGDGSEVGPW
jgi:hypothetical protein